MGQALRPEERNLTTSSIRQDRINLFLHGIEDFQIVRGDTLRQPAFFDRRSPGDLRLRDRQPAFLAGAVGRGDLGQRVPALAATSRGCRLPAAATTPGCSTCCARWRLGRGRMAVVLPHGALFRMGAEGKIRRKILEMDLLEAVIGLGANLFYGTGLGRGDPRLPGPQATGAGGARCSLWMGGGLYRRGPQPEHAGAGARRRRSSRLYRDYRDAPGAAHVATLGRDRAQRLEL